MEFGPCGGVGSDGRCEVADHPCTFLDAPTARWEGAPVAAVLHPAAAALRDRLARGRVVVADLPAEPLSAAGIAECGELLHDRVDAVLCGDSGSARVQFPPAYRARLVQEAGLTVWSGLNNRDRNRVALEGELAGLAAVGVAAVHCVTGDHTATGHRPDAAPVFDLDGTALAALAAARGLTASVAEAPLSPPVAERPARLVAKAAAGASVCVVNHTGDAGMVSDFVAACRGLGASDVTFLACVPVVVSAASVSELRRFTGLATPPGLLDRVAGARSPWATGVDEAVRFAEAVLAVPDVAGVDLSGVAGPGEEAAMAEAMATVGRRLR